MESLELKFLAIEKFGSYFDHFYLDAPKLQTSESRGDDVMIAFFEKKDIPDLRIPSGNESGTNRHWIPGGYTSGNTPEAVVDLNKKVKFKEIKLKFKFK